MRNPVIKMDEEAKKQWIIKPILRLLNPCFTGKVTFRLSKGELSGEPKIAP
jgi:hypothetical protein